MSQIVRDFWNQIVHALITKRTEVDDATCVFPEWSEAGKNIIPSDLLQAELWNCLMSLFSRKIRFQTNYFCPFDNKLSIQRYLSILNGTTDGISL